MRIVRSFKSNPVAASLYCWLSLSNCTTVAETTINPYGIASWTPRLKSYSEVVTHLLTLYSIDQTIVQAEVVILWLTQLDKMMPLLFGKDLFANVICSGGVKGESALRYIPIDSIDESICHCVQKYWAQHGDADLLDLAFESQPLLHVIELKLDHTYYYELYSATRSIALYL